MKYYLLMKIIDGNDKNKTFDFIIYKLTFYESMNKTDAS